MSPKTIGVRSRSASGWACEAAENTGDACQQTVGYRQREEPREVVTRTETATTCRRAPMARRAVRFSNRACTA